MSLQSDLLAINRYHAGYQNTQLPYTIDDVRAILFNHIKFDKSYTFKGLLPPDTISRLRTEGISVELNADNHTVLSWGIR